MQSDLENIERKAPEGKEDAMATAYVPYVPLMVKAISQGSCRPPLCTVGDGLEEPEPYDDVKVSLHIEDVGGAWTLDTPLAMCRYCKPVDDKLFSQEACQDAEQENARRRNHNKWMVDLFRKFMKRYECGASANLMTEPPPPPDFDYERTEKVKELTKDKYGTAKTAIEFLSKHGIYCGKDYKFEEALDKASDVCFEDIVKERAASGKRFRVRLPGVAPSWWDGKSDRDESGRRVRWAKDKCHSFFTPAVVIEPNYEEPSPKITDLVSADDQQQHINSFTQQFEEPRPSITDGSQEDIARNNSFVNQFGERHPPIVDGDPCDDGSDDDGELGLALFG